MDSEESHSKCLEVKVISLIIATPRTWERETSGAEAKIEVWFEYEEKIVRQGNMQLQAQNSKSKENQFGRQREWVWIM